MKNFSTNLSVDSLKSTKHINMKFLVALSCLLAAASASPSAAIATPLAYSNVVSHQVAAAVAAPVAYSSVHVSHAAPVAHAYAAPVAHAYAAPVAHTYAAPAVAHTYAAPAVAAVAAPAVAAVATPIVAAPVVQKTQYHAQDELGQASYGHSEPLQAHNAVQDAAGNKVGSYSYVAPDGQVISANYVADALGYRVASNALPVGPAAVTVDTPEVVAARAAHLNAHALARSRARRSVVAAYAAPYSTAYAGSVYGTHYAAPVYRTATLGTVVNTPGHAVSYHVY